MQLIDVPAAAELLGVSDTWVRRHIVELPTIRVGRLIRLDADKLRAMLSSGNSLRPKEANMRPQRFQEGSVFQRGKKVKVWYGKYRVDVKLPGGIERSQRLVRLGTLAELPTRASARRKLLETMEALPAETKSELTFEKLIEKWEAAEGPTKKSSSLTHYQNALRMYIKPTFGDRQIETISRENIQTFLADKSKTYSRSALRSMRTVLSMTLGWAAACGWIKQNPCVKVKLPREAGGKHVTRTVLTGEQIVKLADALEEPYATLVLFLASTGLRISEATGIQWNDLQNNSVTVRRRVYCGEIDTLKSTDSERTLPLDPELLKRMNALRKPVGELVFVSKAGTPVNPGNALKRYVRPAAKALGVSLGGWHDFRHTLSTNMRKAGVHPVVIKDILGHSRVDLAMNVYDRTDAADLASGLSAVSAQLVSSGIKSEGAA